MAGADAGEGDGGWDGVVGDGGLGVGVAGAVAVDAVEAGGGDGGDVAAFEDAGGSAHAVALRDSAGAGGWLGTIGSEGEGEYIGATAHVGFAEGPVHGFARAPGHAEFVRDGVPEVGLESAREISWFGSWGGGRG